MRDAEVFEADEWRNPQFRLMNADVIRMVAQERLTDRTRAELFEEGRGNGATVGVLHQPSEFVAHPQTRHRGYFVDDVDGLEGLPFATQPVQPARTPSSIRRAGVGGRRIATYARSTPTRGRARARPRPRRCCSTACAWSSSASPRWYPRCAPCSRSSGPT